jgi:SNF2 family DNA or RNA helicase
MKQREQDWSFEDTPESLWVREVDDAGDTMLVALASNLTQSNADRYTNLVTEQSQQKEPSQARGGLLADQMGLGKTLTMISLIALNPAQLASSILITEQGTIRRIKSTLIIVPFTREWLLLCAHRARRTNIDSFGYLGRSTTTVKH